MGGKDDFFGVFHQIFAFGLFVGFLVAASLAQQPVGASTFMQPVRWAFPAPLEPTLFTTPPPPLGYWSGTPKKISGVGHT